MPISRKHQDASKAKSSTKTPTDARCRQATWIEKGTMERRRRFMLQDLRPQQPNQDLGVNVLPTLGLGEMEGSLGG